MYGVECTYFKFVRIYNQSSNGSHAWKFASHIIGFHGKDVVSNNYMMFFLRSKLTIYENI